MSGNIIFLSKMSGIQDHIFHYSDSSEGLLTCTQLTAGMETKLALLLLQLGKLESMDRVCTTYSKMVNSEI